MNDFKMYVFVNNDLAMGKGKIAGQVGHVVQMITEDIIRNKYELRGNPDAYDNYMKWKEAGCPKIILKATQDQIMELSKIGGCRKVHDAGKTQIPCDSLTVVGFYPCQTVTEFNGYKLL